MNLQQTHRERGSAFIFTLGEDSGNAYTRLLTGENENEIIEYMTSLIRRGDALCLTYFIVLRGLKSILML